MGATFGSENPLRFSALHLLGICLYMNSLIFNK